MDAHSEISDRSVSPDHNGSGITTGILPKESGEVFSKPSSKPSYVVVGVLCRVLPRQMEEACACINSLEGMETFSLGEKGRVGALIEARSFDQAHERLQEELMQVEGVQAAWPISTHWD